MQIEGRITEAVVLGFLCICAVFDIHRKEIPSVLIGVGFSAALFGNVWELIKGNISFMEAGSCLLPGIFFLLISLCTREKVGYGDGLMLAVIGLFTGFYHCIFVLCISLILVSVFSLILILMCRAGKESRIAFAPFLAIGMGVGFFV